MPELPEVETMCRCIAPAVGCRIRDVERPRSRLQSITISPRLDCLRRRIVGRRIEAVRRVGKRVVLQLDAGQAKKGTGPICRNGPDGAAHKLDLSPFSPPAGPGDCLVLEPRMTGLVLLAHPPDREHVRLILRLVGKKGTGPICRNGPPGAAHKLDLSPFSPRQILFWDQRGLGVARLMPHADFLRHFGPERLGPDALEIDCETLRARLGRSRRPVKVALLDQHLLAGVGNLYASEILHQSGIDPRTRCDRLRTADWAKLLDAMRDVLTRAITHQGSTLRDGTYRIGHNKLGNYQLYHRVYHRAGEPCLECREGRIVRIVQAQRSTFFCPACQRRA
jgi:formamidopyrimidine-DNA glycosylase